MTPSRALLAAVIAVFAASHIARADEDTPPEGVWRITLGLAAVSRPSHPGATNQTIDINPIVEADYGANIKLSLDDGVRWAAFNDDGWSAGPVAELRFALNDRLPIDQGRAEDAVELGAFVAKDFGVFTVEGRIRKALNGYNGWTGDLAVDSGLNLTDDLQFGVEARMSWGDSRFVKSWYRVGDPNLTNFYSAGVEAALAYALDTHWKAYVQASADKIIGDIAENPQLQGREIYTGSIGATYSFDWDGH